MNEQSPSPPVPFNTVTSPNEQKQNKLKAIALIEVGLFELGFVILGLLIIFGIFNYFNLLPISESLRFLSFLPRQQKIITNTINSTSNTAIASPTQSATSQQKPANNSVSAIANPLTAFQSNFFSKDIKVQASGGFTYSYQTPNKDGKSTYTTNIATGFDNRSAFYFKKGILMRVDVLGTDGSPQNVIVSGNNIFIFSPQTKTYMKGNDDGENALQSKFYNGPFFKGLLPLVQLVEDSKNLVWTRVNDREYTTMWNYNMVETYIKVAAKIDLTPDGSLDSLSLRFPDDKGSLSGAWQKITFSYNTIPNIESLLVMPTGYSLQKF